MKRLWSLATGLAVMMCGAVSAARAETVALNFEVTTVRTEMAIQTETIHPVATAATPIAKAIELSFEPEAIQPSNTVQTVQMIPAPVAEIPSLAETATGYALETLFEEGVNSLVAVSVGNAEGTRTPEGGYTRFYNGHTDPGNRVWNLGTFSYQHGASSPEEADAKQLKRLLGQAQELRRQANAKQMTLTLLEELNGIDLANQAPTTALDRGYIKWLERAKQTPMGESERIVWARTRSFIHPDTGRWNAPGLGNTLESVTRDQRRREQAISKVLEAQSVLK